MRHYRLSVLGVALLATLIGLGMIYALWAAPQEVLALLP